VIALAVPGELRERPALADTFPLLGLFHRSRAGSPQCDRNWTTPSRMEQGGALIRSRRAVRVVHLDAFCPTLHTGADNTPSAARVVITTYRFAEKETGDQVASQPYVNHT
jgi:hypothetical protein